MGVYNEILIGRWNRFIQKLTGIKGGPPARQLSSEIVIGHDIQTGVENRYLEGWERFGFVVSQTGAAAQTSDIRFRNPAGSNVIAVAEQLIVASPAVAINGFIEIAATGVDLATIVPMTSARLDARSRPTPTLIASKTNGGTPLIAIGTYGVPQALSAISFILTQNQEITILPGDALQINEQVANTQLSISMVWRERFLEDSERF